MPRKRLYHTKEEQRLANNTKAKRWREKNRNVIRERRQEKQQALEEERARARRIQRKKERILKEREEREKERAVRETTKSSLMDESRPVKELEYSRKLHAMFLERHPSRYNFLQETYLEFMAPSIPGHIYRPDTFFDNCLRPFNEVEVLLRRSQARVLLYHGPCDEWKAIGSMHEDIKEFSDWVEDMYCSAILGHSALKKAHDRRELKYQQV
ncbi:hypothetical protein V5O48_015819 [Marasmius crinis-equi]|uniref:Uncharacterized protein n=1 Tax=Marasmius crinis-equi TaxID=585013 RepID=A0ABR3ETE7_9AGAR